MLETEEIQKTLTRIAPAVLETVKGLEDRFREDFAVTRAEVRGTDFFWGARARCEQLLEHWGELPRPTAAELPGADQKQLGALWRWASGFLVGTATVFDASGMSYEAGCIRDACRRILVMHPEIKPK